MELCLGPADFFEALAFLVDAVVFLDELAFLAATGLGRAALDFSEVVGFAETAALGFSVAAEDVGAAALGFSATFFSNSAATASTSTFFISGCALSRFMVEMRRCARNLSRWPLVDSFRLPIIMVFRMQR